MLSVRELVCRVYCGVLVVIWILAPYGILQRVDVFAVTWMPELALDRMVPVCLGGVWVYFSYCFLLVLVGLGVEKRLFVHYLYAIGWVAAVSHAVFLFFPTGVMRSEVDVGGAPVLYRVLVFLDLPRNALPSLHASLSVLAGMAVHFSVVYGGWVKFFVWLWVGGIFWSTMALRQHVVLDLLAGGVLAVVVWFVVGRSGELRHHGV